MRDPSTVRTVLADLGREVLDLVVPRECLGCNDPGRSLCPRCASALWVDTRRRDPLPRPAGLPAAWSAAPYRDLARDAILAHKERGDRGLTAPLGRALAAAVAAAVAAACSACSARWRRRASVRSVRLARATGSSCRERCRCGRRPAWYRVRAFEASAGNAC